MQISVILKALTQKAFKSLYGLDVFPQEITLNETKPEFEGDYTIVLFSFVKALRKSPDALGAEMGAWLMANNDGTLASFNVIKGFLNLSVTDAFWIDFLAKNNTAGYGMQPANGKKVMVEYSSPNTNKPLHLGHLRNNFLGWSVAQMYKANGWEVMKSCIVNDRGIHICKSMLAWQKFGNGATPESTGKKGDHLVGDFYVMFENALKAQSQPLLQALLETGNLARLDDATATKAIALFAKFTTAELGDEKRDEVKAELNEIARNATELMQEVRAMLLKWEQGDAETLALWKMMNGWVYAGFDTTYKRIGSDFDKIYYESDTYLLGKKMVEEGLAKGVFFKKPDSSVWIDLTEDGLDEKLVMRKDGTSVYITQDIGLADTKYREFPMEESIYVIGDEQNYHMKVLQLICKKLDMPFASGIHHLSYGMVELPSGRMKSREGTVVDADDLCDEMEQVAAAKTEELGKVKDFTEDGLKELHHTLGLGALKFYLLRVDPKKKMVFNPEESIDFQGFTAPFIQFNHARIQSLLRKIDMDNSIGWGSDLLPLEKKIIVTIEQYKNIVEEACTEMNPSLIAIYIYNLAKSFSSFFTEHQIAKAETEEKKQLRLAISQLTGYTLKHGMQLLGIEVPDRM